MSQRICCVVVLAVTLKRTVRTQSVLNKNVIGRKQSMKTFAKPIIGSIVTITTRFKEQYLYSEEQYRTETVQILPDEKWFKPDEFKVASINSLLPFRVISLRNVISLKVRNKTTHTNNKTETKVVLVKGTKGSENWVTLKNNLPISCTCQGFTYRQACRHLKESMGDVDLLRKVEDTLPNS